ncbi:MAG: hypothetical protein HRU15_03655 [Planctomycetes bacterium]|nr:hypothetical protein [Planctomycetota bacterium]
MYRFTLLLVAIGFTVLLGCSQHVYYSGNRANVLLEGVFANRNVEYAMTQMIDYGNGDTFNDIVAFRENNKIKVWKVKLGALVAEYSNINEGIELLYFYTDSDLGKKPESRTRVYVYEFNPSSGELIFADVKQTTRMLR